MSAAGTYVRLGPGSIAFDSAAGFLAALVLGPGAGALICSLGHLAAAAVTGFPLTLPFHLLIAVSMAGVGALGGAVAVRTNLLAGAVALVLANGVLVPALLSLVPNPMGRALFVTLVLPLTLAATANAVVAVIVARVLKRSRLVS